MTSNFKSPMLRSERITGIIYLAVHIFLLPWLLIYIYTNVVRNLNVVLTSPNLNLLYYSISFLFVFSFLFRFLKASFSDLADKLIISVKSIALAFLFDYVMAALVSLLLSLVLKDVSNPNSQAVISQAKLDAGAMVFVAVLLVPIVEETLFRGVLFGTLRSKSRVLAYAVSALVFAFYHLWQFFLGGFEWTICLYLLQYIPPALALAWCYETSGSIWAPILLHAALNFISIKVTLG